MLIPSSSFLWPAPSDSAFGSTSGVPVGNQCQGSAVASYSATPEVDGNGKIMSISAMPVYRNKSHEELKLENYELNKGLPFSIQNQESAFQQSNPPFGPCTVSAPSIESSFGSLSVLAPGTATAALGTSVQPPFGSTSTAFGVQPSLQFGGSNGDGNVDQYPINSAAGASSINFFCAPKNSGVGFKATPTVLPQNPENVSTSSIFGVSSMPPFAPASASSEFKTSIFVLPCTSGFRFSTTSASSNSSIFGIQTSSGSQGTRIESTASKQCQGSAVASYSATPAVDNGYSRCAVEKIQSISVMPIYEDKSHEELRWEDYQLCNKGSHGKSAIESTVSKKCQASGVASYSAITAVDDGYSRYPVEKIHSISALPIYGDKGHEELRWENYQLGNRGGQTHWGGQFLRSSCFKTSDTPFIFRSAPLSNQCSVKSLFQPFKSNLSVNPFSGTNLYQSRSQAFIPRPRAASSMPTFALNLNPSSSFHFSQSMLANISQWLKTSKTLTSPSVGKFSLSKPLVKAEKVEESPSNNDLTQPSQDAVTVKYEEADVLAIMPKLPVGEYYTEPSIKELAAKEMAKPGSCSRVNGFVVGRRGYGSIKFLGETDIRHLDLESIIQFNNREVTLYLDYRKKTPVGQSLNKPAEVTLLNVKCINKKTGKQYVEGPKVLSYTEKLIKKTSERGAEFVSYDPVQGEWKFRVQHL